ncbi:hypothetical protein A8C56_17070 [Niabella ginsenosidivorans]|uniref:Uncharacterized protein n=1 Tax=Niabella ginsenosidivorans TaxID=1176587 RepID=A0A1A9I6Y0_9BACT|nr:hypothetical protein [Niabella ginsenosidivorans]ANH82451.1 hypothetical protein A8C56_17070 [Niabella ginsenosidivorans]
MKQLLVLWMALSITAIASSQSGNCRINFPDAPQKRPGYVALDTFLNQFQLAFMLEHQNATIDKVYTARILGIRNGKWQRLLVTGTYHPGRKKYEVTGAYTDADQEWANNQFTALCAEGAFNLNPQVLNQNPVIKVKDTTIIQNAVTDEGTDYITICQQGKRKVFSISGLNVLLEFFNKYDIENKSLLQFREIKAFIEAQ